jgi:hypothetical protein
VRKFARDQLLEHLECDAEIASVGLADQQMDVFRHDDVSEHVETVAAASAFEFAFKDLFCVRRVQQRQAAIAQLKVRK